MCLKRIHSLGVPLRWLEWRRCSMIFSLNYLGLHSSFFVCFLRGKTQIYMVDCLALCFVKTVIFFRICPIIELICILKVHGNERILLTLELLLSVWLLWGSMTSILQMFSLRLMRRWGLSWYMTNWEFPPAIPLYFWVLF